MNFTASVGATLPQSQIVGVTSTGAVLPVSTSIRYFSGAEGWITTEVSSNQTPSNVTITVNSANLAVGVYTGQVLVVASASQSALVTVGLTVTGSATGSLLTSSPNTLSITSTDGLIAQSTLVITSSGSVPFQAYTSTASGGNWLSMNIVTATSPTSFVVSANPANMAPGVYTGTITLVPTAGGTGLTIPVTFTVSSAGSAGFSVSPATVNFSYQTGGATPGGQSVYVNNTTAIVSYTATASTSWMKLTSNLIGSPAQTVTGNSNSYLNIYVDPTALSSGSYSGTITVTSSAGAVQTVGVNLSVNGSGGLTASPTALTFNYLPETGVPVSQQVVLSSSGTSVNFSASASSSGWLQVGPQNGNTGTSPIVTVSVTPLSLPNGTYTGYVNVTTGATSVSIPVTLNVGISNTTAITASPASLTFNAPFNGPSASQSVLLSSLTTKSFIANVSTVTGNWLQVNPTGGFSPGTLNVIINPQAVSSAGTYTGTIVVSNLTDNTQFTIPVSMVLSGATLIATPQALSFTMPAGATTASTQVVQLSGTSGTIFTATSDSSWLSVTPTSASIPSGITVQAASASLSPGNYAGVITVTSGGVSTNISVSLTVTAASVPLLSPTILNFNYISGSAVPAAQSIAVNSTTGTPLNFTTSTQTGSGTTWFSAAANAFTTPASIAVTVQPGGLTPGTYRGVVVVRASSSGETRTAEVVLTVTAPLAPTLSNSLHGATRQLSAITPGMLLSLRGTGMGPAQGANGNVTTAGAFETFYGAYRVYFDGIAAPIIYISDTRVDTAVPYSVAGRRSVRVEVDNAGVRSNPMDLVISPDAAPGIYTSDGSGLGQAAVVNQNGSLNGPGNPAAAGTVISFFATGEGQTEPVGQDGRIISTDLRKPVLPVAVNIGGVAAEVVYAGSAPGLISGLMQVNVRVPADAPKGALIPIELRVGPAPSPSGVTIAVQ